MTVEYTKQPQGNKLYTIQWDLDPADENEVNGEAFQAIDCKPLSFFAYSGGGILCKLHASNLWDADVHTDRALGINVSDIVLVPLTPEASPIVLPPARWYWPSAEGSAGLSKVAILFEEIL